MEKLFDKVYMLCKLEVESQYRHLIENTMKILPDLDEMTNFILQKSNFDVDEGMYEMLRDMYLEILNDIVEGMEKKDTVLLYDALAFGLLEYLEIFLDDVKRVKL